MPVPPGFTISTEVCDLFYKNKKKLPSNSFKNIQQNLELLKNLQVKNLVT